MDGWIGVAVKSFFNLRITSFIFTRFFLAPSCDFSTVGSVGGSRKMRTLTLFFPLPDSYFSTGAVGVDRASGGVQTRGEESVVDGDLSSLAAVSEARGRVFSACKSCWGFPLLVCEDVMRVMGGMTVFRVGATDEIACWRSKASGTRCSVWTTGTGPNLVEARERVWTRCRRNCENEIFFFNIASRTRYASRISRLPPKIQ